MALSLSLSRKFLKAHTTDTELTAQTALDFAADVEAK